MRLIDADKLELKHFVQWTDVIVGYNGTQPEHKHTDIIAYDISGAPTVKAIPIEWIKKYYEDITMPYTDIRIQFEELIRKWEKDNETN